MMEEAPVKHPPTNRNGLKIFILLAVFAGFLSTFVAGFMVSKYLASENNVTTSTLKPFIKPTNSSKRIENENPEIIQDSTKFLPGKEYIDDTIMLVSKDEPRISVVATVTRIEQETNYAQNTRASYFDGTKWERVSTSKASTDSTILSNRIVKNWNTVIDPTRVLKQTAQGEINVNGTSVKFTTSTLENEIGMRSLPGYTKFMSNSTGNIVVDGKIIPAYVLYTRIYSLNANEIQFYSQPFGLTTDWIAFWDENGKFYHIDMTSVEKPTPTYQTHQIGVFEDANGAVSKTFSLNILRDTEVPPNEYTVTINTPIDATLKLSRQDKLNKSLSGSYKWFIGNFKGTVTKDGQTVKGFGLVEYINN